MWFSLRRKESQARNQREAGNNQSLFHLSLLLGLFFDPEDGGEMFFGNFGWLSTDYMALYPRRQNSP
jgi:hypothetical protein